MLVCTGTVLNGVLVPDGVPDLSQFHSAGCLIEHPKEKPSGICWKRKTVSSGFIRRG